jgi:hypothetical protein
MRAVGPHLSDRQLALINQHASSLPPILRDRFRAYMADRLTGECSDYAVTTVINNGLNWCSSFLKT